ncbi:MAG: hypothetical protein PHC95_12765 [Parabacteroides sp.]|nr:hypothetical protein [Parabacteroides sp.]
MEDLKHNGEGYKDPTAYNAIKKADKESERFHKLLAHIFYICDLAGFHIEGHITLVDTTTGKVWR